MHAYLIIAHGHFVQLQLLINLLDDNRNDIFVHIDKKAGPIPILKAEKSKLMVLERRIDVRWGDISQMQVELLLLETAVTHNQYKYYHIISGLDLPIKTNDYIHNFFNENNGKEFVGFSNINSKRLKKNVCYYHLFTRHYRQNNILLKIVTKTTRTILEVIINIFIKNNNPNELKKGVNWVSITHEFCNYIIERKKELLEQYAHTKCCDEIFIHTLLWKSPFKNNIYNANDEFGGCMRLIDWKRGRPYIWGRDLEYDKDLILSSKFLFARKFDIEKYPEVVYFVKNMLKHE